MRRRVVWVFLLLFAVSVGARQLPLTAQDVSLMLRGGFSSATVVQELSNRHFVDTLDAAKEAKLVQAGATSELIRAIKSGQFSVPPEEIARAEQDLTTEAKRKAMESERSRKLNTLYQAKLAQERAAAAARPTVSTNAIHPMVKGDLIALHQGAPGRFDDEALAGKKLIALYFSAHWCGPCRKFTPQLVEYYKRVAAQHPEFELIFVSADRSAFAMQTYMRETNMPWPAIDYQKLPSKAEIMKYAGQGIPCLVLIDATGKVISDSYAGSNYLGPEKVVADLEAIFSGKAPAQVAVKR